MRPYMMLMVAFIPAFITAGCSDGGGDGGSAAPAAPADTTAPTVISTGLPDGATDAPVNRKATATFSEEMDPATITGTTFTLTQGGTPVSGTVTSAGAGATFTPDSNLAATTTYTGTITTGTADLAGNALAAAKVWSFTTGTAADTVAPTVSSTNPADGATGVLLNHQVSVSFGEAIDPTTITGTTFTLMQGATPVPGTVTSVGNAATFTPDGNLAASTLFTATITTGAADLAGNPLAAAKVWSFTTGAAPDTTAPIMSSTNPPDGDTGVPVNRAIAATFSEPMAPGTITETTFTLMQGATPVSGAVTYSGSVATFTPVSDLAASTLFTATITTGVADLAGNALAANTVWSFTTGTAPDVTAPTVSSTDPANGDGGVPINRTITATFDEAMDPATITGVTFTLLEGITPVSGTVTSVGSVATFTPAADLAASTVFTATITTGAADLAGNALGADSTWSFTTGSAPAAGPAPVVLGTAGSFVILSKSGISSTGTTSIVGDLGVSPIDSTAITGFGLVMDPSNQFSTSTLVTGSIFAADYTAPTPANLTTAVLDMQNAFTDAAGRPIPGFSELGAGNIDGMTLVPGLYKWGTGVTIPIGVTLTGGANDVWIFQIAQDLTVGNGAIVTLAGSAKSKNIFWQVSGLVSLGTTADFKGIVLCQTMMAMNTGSVMNGRVLVQTAATMDATSVTPPAP